LFRESVLILPAAELRVLIVLLHIHKSQARGRGPDVTTASVKVLQSELMRRTGVRSQASMSKALHGLQEAGFVQIVWDNKGSTKRGEVSSEYILTDPETREPFPVLYRSGNVLGALKMRYFQISICLLTSAAHWSLANLSGSEVKLYIAMLWLANLEHSHHFERTHAAVYRAAHLTFVTFKKALEGLQVRGLIFVVEDEASKSVIVHLCDPFFREPMHVPDLDDRNDPANYTTSNAKGVQKRLSWNEGTDADWEQIVRDAVPAGDRVTKSTDGELQIHCPFHEDGTPSCSVSLRKRCYFCHGCTTSNRTGTLTSLLAKLTGSKSDAIRRIGSGLGKKVDFHQPDSEAIAKYDYLDASGKPLKRVLRLSDDEEGNKRISQRGWTDTGWVHTVKGIGPVLYNAQRIMNAGTIVIVEGEKDADTVTNLHLGGRGGETVAVTSGGKGTWHPKLAKQLRGKVVIVMPDNDAPGEAYAEAVRASLDAQCIEYKTVSFAGTGAKDVTEYLQNGHTAEELVNLIDSDWVTMQEASHHGMPADDEIVEA
jgi:5S rRNA maturation endonuclease (ribonuclease M5)